MTARLGRMIHTIRDHANRVQNIRRALISQRNNSPCVAAADADDHAVVVEPKTDITDCNVVQHSTSTDCPMVANIYDRLFASRVLWPRFVCVCFFCCCVCCLESLYVKRRHSPGDLVLHRALLHIDGERPNRTMRSDALARF